MKTSIKKVIEFCGLPIEIVTPKFSPFVVNIHVNGVRISYGDEVIAQQHIHRNQNDADAELKVALDSAYRKAALFLAFNNPFALSSLYRHIVRHYTDGKIKPNVWPSDKDYVEGIINMTTRAHDINIPMVAETELNDPTETTFDLTLRHDGVMYTANGNSYHIEMASALTALPFLNEVEG